MAAFADRVRGGEWKGHTGKRIRNVVNIGIGGSDLGPKLACEALEASDDVRGGAPGVAFVSNVDPEHLWRALSDHDPAATLFIVTSKTFTTQETLANAQSAREWLRRALGEGRDLSPHFLAVTSNVDAAVRFGVRAEDVLPMSEGVGGRYSLWSAVGLVIAVRAGWRAYCELLDGAQAMDTHFRMAPLARNLPVILALPRSSAARRDSLRRSPRAASGIPATAIARKQRQARATRRHAGRRSNGAGIVGRRRHEQSARVLSVAPPGNA
jgi:glucose-6-phosphate isomerase